MGPKCYTPRTSTSEVKADPQTIKFLQLNIRFPLIYFYLYWSGLIPPQGQVLFYSWYLLGYTRTGRY